MQEDAAAAIHQEGPHFLDIPGVKGVAVSHKDGLNVLLFVDLTTPDVPIPSALRIEQGPPLTRPQVGELLDGWEPTPDGTPLTTSTLRAVNVGTLARSFQTLAISRSRHPSRSAQIRAAGQAPQPSVHLQSLYAALVYSQAVADGNPHPAKAVAEVLDTNDSQARNLIRTARQKGYLSKGIERRAGGQLTELGRSMIDLYASPDSE